MNCLGCGLALHPAITCRQAEAKARLSGAVVVHTEEAAPIGSPPLGCLVVHTSRHGQYADAEKRRAYKREWMRVKRAAGG